ncbi:MAG: type II toxin-antitoxin system RelE/ParE family toxin [Candidatus Thermoplasmatota archaeon]|nr:type II toxin-antitoxin system RelE/ParE family toxin [Candidatus Thermoplasmatota archaeon]
MKKLWRGGVVIVFELRYSNRFAQQSKNILGSKDLKFKEHLIEHIKVLGDDPYHSRPGCDIKKIEAQGNSYRLRIGDYRVMYEIDPEEHVVYLVQIFFRGRGYR